MLLVLIDILERLLAWLKPFALARKQTPEQPGHDQTSAPPQPGARATTWNAEIDSLLPAQPAELPVVTALKTMMRNTKLNKNPKIPGYIAEKGTGIILYPPIDPGQRPVRANTVVWQTLQRDWGRQYDIHWGG